MFGRGDEEMPPSYEIKKVSIETYWKAHLKAYLLGLGDLLGRNIGISPDGKIRFFDAEYCFFYKNHVHQSGEVIGMGFLAESFDWPQYRDPLDKKTAESLRAFVQGLGSLEENFSLYEHLRTVSLFTEGTYERLQKVRTFLLEEGKTFRDFVGFLYPSIDPGLDQLNQIVGRIYKRKVDHGASLIFLSQHIVKYKLSQEQRREVREWVDYYVP